MKTIVEHYFTGSTVRRPSYDATKTTLGPHIEQATGATAKDKWAGPMNFRFIRSYDQSTTVYWAFPSIIKWSTTRWYIIAGSILTAATNRHLSLFTFNPTTADLLFVGHLRLNPFPSVATNVTIVGLKAAYDKHTTGTVAVSGTAVTGSSTSWQTDGACVGNRIGFGSTDPTAITTWYEISAIGGDGALTLTASAGTIAAGTAYVIEDLRVAIATTNATATNGGLFLVKGLRFELFQSAGFPDIPAATTIDNIRATYWLADAATVTMTQARGLACDSSGTLASHFVYIVSGSTTALQGIYKYDIRAPLTGLSGGKTTSAFVLKTGGVTTSGNITQPDNGRFATAAHGPQAGVPCIYWVTQTRVYATPIANIVAGGTNLLVEQFLEVPPGSTDTYLASGALSNVEYSATMDRFIINISNSMFYLTRLQSGNVPFDYITQSYCRRNSIATQDPDAPELPLCSVATTVISCELTEGWLVAVTMNAGVDNKMVVLPIGCHDEFADAGPDLLVLPAMSFTNIRRYSALYVNEALMEGDMQHGCPREGWRVYYRTSGIDDDSGSWTEITAPYDLSTVPVVSRIQLAFRFKVMGWNMLTARIWSVGVAAEVDDSLPDQFRWNLADCNETSGICGFIQSSLFGTSIPDLLISYYRSDTDVLVFEQDSTGSTNGVFEYWSGAAWVAGLGTDTLNTRRRFRPTAGLPTGVSVYAILELL